MGAVGKDDVDDALAALRQAVGDRKPSRARPAQDRLTAAEAGNLLDALREGTPGDHDTALEPPAAGPALPPDDVPVPSIPAAMTTASEPVISSPPVPEKRPITPSEHADLEAEEAFFASLDLGALATPAAPAPFEAGMAAEDTQRAELDEVTPTTGDPHDEEAAESPASRTMASVVPPAPPSADEVTETRPLTSTGSWRVSREDILRKPEGGSEAPAAFFEDDNPRGDSTEVVQTGSVSGVSDDEDDDLEMVIDDDVQVVWTKPPPAPNAEEADRDVDQFIDEWLEDPDS